MSQAINAYYTITPFSESQERERLFEKASHDEAQALYNAEQRGRQEGLQDGRQEKALEIAQKLISLGVPKEQILQATGLSYEKIKELINSKPLAD